MVIYIWVTLYYSPQFLRFSTFRMPSILLVFGLSKCHLLVALFGPGNHDRIVVNLPRFFLWQIVAVIVSLLAVGLVRLGCWLIALFSVTSYEKIF